MTWESLDLRSWSTEGEDSTGDLPIEEAEPKDQSLRKATSCNTPEAQGARGNQGNQGGGRGRSWNDGDNVAKQLKKRMKERTNGQASYFAFSSIH